jgi:hypothetical protein
MLESIGYTSSRKDRMMRRVDLLLVLPSGYRLVRIARSRATGCVRV